MNRAAAKWLFWGLALPVLSLGLLVDKAAEIGPAWRAHLGTGTPGIYTYGPRECVRGECTRLGDWISDDGRTALRRVHVIDAPDGEVREDDTVRALYTGNSAGVYVAGGGAWLADAALLLLGLLGLAGWSVGVIIRAAGPVRRWRERRAEQLARRERYARQGRMLAEHAAPPAP
ncbi:hypothetical protein [Catellatospora sp. TT07R-123]|uniref:hypothetical protein n=1 Tax=Catellatospora sp. TT07R-123 TaxID=2733863 RepID=UPI001BB37598|nr:hypothetical protein [Catellatospora sp. TT07R-123]